MCDNQELSVQACAHLGDLANLRRRQLGISSFTLAVEASVPVSSVTDLEHGYGLPAEDEMRRIEKCLGWADGAATKALSTIRPDRVPVEWILMETLDEEDCKTYGHIDTTDYMAELD